MDASARIQSARRHYLMVYNTGMACELPATCLYASFKLIANLGGWMP